MWHVDRQAIVGAINPALRPAVEPPQPTQRPDIQSLTRPKKKGVRDNGHTNGRQSALLL